MRIRFERMSVSRKVAGMVVLILVTSFLVQIAFILPLFRRHSIEYTTTLLKADARSVAGSLDRVLEMAKLEAEKAAALPEMASMSRERLDPLLAALNRTSPHFIHYSVMNLDGIIISRPDKPERVGENRSERTYFSDVLRTGRTSFSSVFLSTAGNLTTDIGAPIYAKDGSMKGVLVAAIGVDERNVDIFRGIIDIPAENGILAYMVDRDGRLIARSGQGTPSTGFLLEEKYQSPFTKDLIEGKEGDGIFTIRQERWIAAYVPIRTSGWGVVIQQPLSRISGHSAPMLVSLLSILSVMLVAGSLLSVYLVRNLLSPLKTLSRVTGEATGSHPGERTQDEIVLLSSKIGRMIEATRRSEESLKKANEELVREVSSRRRAEAELTLRAAVLDTQLENSPDGILVVGLDGGIISFNRRFMRMWKIPDWILAKRSDDLALKYIDNRLANPGQFYARVRHLYSHPDEESQDEIRLLDGRVFERLSSSMRGNDGKLYGRAWYFRDITDKKKSDEEIRRSLREKEVLLKEVHHRVKNNLQAVSGILDLQVARLPEGKTARILRDSKNRIHTMALLHEKLCEKENQTTVNLVEYISALTQHLKMSIGVKESSITIRDDIEDLDLNLDTAIPCGLIITELVSNSLKYAFPKKTGEEEIAIKLSLSGDGYYKLVVSDNGVGIPADLDLNRLSTLGLRLVSTLVEQLSGSMDIDRERGTTYTISFREYHEYQGAL